VKKIYKFKNNADVYLPANLQPFINNYGLVQSNPSYHSGAFEAETLLRNILLPLLQTKQGQRGVRLVRRLS